MSKEYKYDKAYLKSLLDRCYEMLQSNSLSTQKRENIQADIFFLENALVDKYEINISNSGRNSNKSFSELKSEFILFLKYLYHKLGDRGIQFISNLYESDIFGCYLQPKFVQIPDETIVKATLKTYESHVPFLLPSAKKILSLSPTPHVFLTQDPDIDSFCHCCDIVPESFVIANTFDSSSVLCHELEHAVEDSLNINYLLEETGPILLEMFFADTVLASEGINDFYSLAERVEDTGDYLDFLVEFLNFTKALAKRKFNVSNRDFIQMFNEHIKIYDGDVEGYLREEFPEDDISLYIEYLFSFLNAIDMYTKINGNNGDISKLLRDAFTQKKLSIPDENTSFSIYSDYVNTLSKKLK